MRKQTFDSSPQFYARLAGLLYLVMIVLGIVQEFVIRGRIIVPGEAAATATNLSRMESLWRLGVAAELFLAIITVVLALITYLLTKPVNKNLALLALLFNVLAMAVESAYALELLQALFPLGNSAYLKAFTPEQLYALASLSIRAHSIGFGIALFLFGPFFLLTGNLIYRSGYFPKALGLVYMIPGVSYLTSSFALIVAPNFADRFYFVMAGPAFLGEMSLCLWLMIKGVNVSKWTQTVTQ